MELLSINRALVAKRAERFLDTVKSRAADDKGFISIAETLQCEGGPDNVFACGDAASCKKHPRPKAGVFAVRQGPALATNLRK